MRSGAMARCCRRWRTTAASRRPQRVPMGRPSSGEKLMVVATDRPSRMAQIEAPCPRCAATTRPAEEAPRRELRADRLVGNAVEAVAAHALVVQRARQGEALVELRLRAVEGGVEARHLRHAREGVARGAHALEVVRLVQRGQGLEGREPREDRVVDRDRVVELDAAMDDAVAHRGHAHVRRVLAQQAQRRPQRVVVGRGGAALRPPGPRRRAPRPRRPARAAARAIPGRRRSPRAAARLRGGRPGRART